MKALLRRLHADEHGTVSIEYALLLGMVAVAVITAVATISAWVTGRFEATAAALS